MYARATLYRLRLLAEAEATSALAGLNFKDYERGLDRVQLAEDDDDYEQEETT